MAKLTFITTRVDLTNSHIILPNVHRIIASLQSADEAVDNDFLNKTTEKLKVVLFKMNYDTETRLAHTMTVFRACRMFNYKFIAQTPMDALQVEFQRLALLPGISGDLRKKIYEEFSDYKKKADYENLQDNPIDLWGFFVKYHIDMPYTYRGACEAALITPSSATSERVFAQYASCFDDKMNCALEDRRAASVLLRMNERFRYLENL